MTPTPEQLQRARLLLAEADAKETQARNEAARLRREALTLLGGGARRRPRPAMGPLRVEDYP